MAENGHRLLDPIIDAVEEARPRRDDLLRSRAASPPPPVRHKVLGTTTATSNRHREMVDMQTPAPVPRGRRRPAIGGRQVPRRPASRANHGRRTASPWVGQPPQIPQSGRRPPRLPPLTGPSPPQDKQRPACMPDCVHEHRPTTSPGSAPGPRQRSPPLGRWCLPHEHKPTLPLRAGQPPGVRRVVPAYLAVYTNTGPHFPSAGGEPVRPSKALGGRVVGGTPELVNRRAEENRNQGVPGNGSTCTHPYTPAGTQAAVYAGRPDGLYAGVHGDTATGVTATTYARVQVRLRAGTPANAYA